MDDGVNVPGICAKARTANGTTKSGSACDAGTWYRTSQFAKYPESNAYGYWGDGGCHRWGPRRFHVYAET